MNFRAEAARQFGPPKNVQDYRSGVRIFIGGFHEKSRNRIGNPVYDCRRIGRAPWLDRLR
jgi:hypothetical protein